MNYLIKDKKMEFASVPVIDTWRAMEKLGILNNILPAIFVYTPLEAYKATFLGKLTHPFHFWFY